MKESISIVIPTYNGKENIITLLTNIQNVIEKITLNYEIIIVDDNSPDGKGKIINIISEKNKKIKVILRSVKTGLGDAYKTGFQHVRGEIILEIDAYLSYYQHLRFLTNLKNNNVIIGSRYIRVVGNYNWSKLRIIISSIANFLEPIFFKLHLNNLPSGYRLYKRKIIRKPYFRNLRMNFTEGLFRKGKSAIFTIVRDEKERLSLWLKYYLRFFNKNDIYILNHNSTDDGTKNIGCKLFKITCKPFSAFWQASIASTFLKQLLKFYEIVLYTDVDEIIAPDPEKYQDLSDYIRRFENDYVRCTGYEIVHLKALEPPIDFDKPIIAQRKFWYPRKLFNKPLITKKFINWEPGFHSADKYIKIDSELFLIHLHKLDYELCKNITAQRSKRRRDKLDLTLNFGYHNRLIGNDFDKWFSSMNDANGSLEIIPKKFQSIL